MRIFRYLTSAAFGCAAALLTGVSSAQDAASLDSLSDLEKGERVFALHVDRILSSKCIACHGEDEDKIKGDLDMRTLEGLLAGGETSKDVLVPGKAEESLLMTAITWADPDYEMPPKENDRLTEEQVEKVRNWINWGAPWPSDEVREKWTTIERAKKRTDEGVIVDTIGGLDDGWTYRRYQDEAIWAFQPVTDPEVPEVEGVTHPVDAFVRSRLAEAGFEPAPAADARTLLRRATYDLTGLPPTPEEIESFLAASEKDPEAAYEALIDRLLASPHYGERWAQHWLDVVRWADTGGFSNDYERSNAWRYRDYVIRSLNNDKPYNEFVREQLAGDEIDPENPEMMVATGFLRAGAYDNAMVLAPVARQNFLDDLVNGVGQSLLGTAMRCCKCHDHKFDPLPTEDYYRMYATFAGTYPVERDVPFLEEENRIGFEEGKAEVDKLHKFAQSRFQALEKKKKALIDEWYEERGKGDLTAKEREALPDSEQPPYNVGLTDQEEGRVKVRRQDVWIWERRKERYWPMAQSVWNGFLPVANARSLRIPPEAKQKKDWAPENFILTGGGLDAEGKAVTPGVISATGLPTSTGTEEDPFALPTTLDGRRTAFADWVADPENPLSTRAIVNRIWGYHFAKAIAANPNNIGGKGALPTHPELLDWLTSDFLENGWSQKHLHRLIMTSETYRMGTLHPDRSALAQVDPDNKLLAFHEPRRLTAEEVRDSMLAVTGELNLEMGGVPARPEINREVAFQPRMIQFSLAPAYTPSRTPEERNRRSIYAYKVRGQPDPFLQILNMADPNESCELRDSAAVSPQAFTLMNSDVVTDRSIAFALSLQEAGGDVRAKMDRAFQLTLARAATDKELDYFENFVAEMVEHHLGHQPKPVSYPTHLTRSLVEEFSGKEFNYDEYLPVFEDYVPDVKADQVSPEVRALADACLVLFNSNEFVYVY